ncbi:MAG: hypothetical protein COB45_05180 [Gammaproteobacteria bacterium]|jgi:biotin carboxylase|nr:MAG: hypothetical protein COB45_05180 [Gammaproteobacteria bacterium]PHR82769.1 MAG: hypothetical protein COA59_14185 [Colwellia sp.]
MSSEKSSYGFLSPQPYMKSAIENMNERINVEVIEAKTWENQEIDNIVATCKEKGIKSVGGFAQKDAFHHILINAKLGNVTPGRTAFLYCMNKYLMRTLEENPFFFDSVDPLNETDEQIISKIKEWPFMLKNTSLSLGRGIYKINNEDELRSVLKNYRADTALQEQIAFQYDAYLEGIDRSTLPTNIPPFIAEHMVDMNTAIEYCYEGYITATGEVVHYALTEEIYFSNHQALGYVTPPISIDSKMAEKIESWVNTYMGKMAKLGYINQFFNLEFWIMPDGSIALTEINPRAAHSYHYNYRHSFNSSLYEDNFKLAAGESVPENTPWKKWRNNDDYKYTLIVLITANHTGTVSDILDYDYIEHLEQKEGILIRHNRQHAEVLSDSDMTAAGVMLMQMWVVGDSREEVIKKEHDIRRKIYKQEQAAAKYPPYWDV